MNIGGIPGVIVDHSSLSQDERTLTITCHDNAGLGLSFNIVITAPAGEIAALIQIDVTNNSSAEIFLKMQTPHILGMVTPGYAVDPYRMIGMIPQEIGSIVTLHNNVVVGMPPLGSDGTSVQLPQGFNSMEVACLYDRDGGGGVFFADMEGDFNRGIPTICYNLSEYELIGTFVKQFFQPGETVSLPKQAIGVFNSGDYHTAVKYFVDAHRPFWSFPDVPAWFKEAGGIWSTCEEGSGGAYQLLPNKLDLKDQITSFADLPLLYDQAAAMGTNLFYLNDYWEGDGSFWPPYMNKGDYIPRSDLGGEAALIEGIQGIHAKGGKVIAYVEGFIVYVNSEIAKTQAENWSLRTADGQMWTCYPMQICMLYHSPGWQNYIIDVCTRLVRDYDIDGIFFDSNGWQMNRSAKSTDFSTMCNYIEWNQGVYDFITKVRDAIRQIKPDAVVMSESGGSGLFFYEDGGLSADYVWSSASNEGRIVASPIRYGIPEGNFSSNGRPDFLNHLTQIYAAGHSLTLNHLWNGAAPFIKLLLDTRRAYKDAMIYGEQAYQPNTGTMWVAAYMYRGTVNKVMTIVSLAADVMSVNIQLEAAESNTQWTDVLTGELFFAINQSMTVSMPSALSETYGLRILVENPVADPGFELQATSTVSSPWASAGMCGIDRNLGWQLYGLNNAWIIPQPGDNRIYQDIPVQTDTNYRLTGFIQTSGPDAEGAFGVMTTSGTVIEETAIGYRPVYTKVDVDFNSGSNTTIRIYLRMNGQASVTFSRLDNVSLIRH